MRKIAERYHDISCGHRVVGHEGKCAFLHGHNYRIHFTCSCWEPAALDVVGRVLDFSAIKSRLCMWVEEAWDHKFLAWEKDTFLHCIQQHLPPGDATAHFRESIVWVPFNPTAELMAAYLLEVIGPQQLEGTGVRLVRVCVEETRRCSAIADLSEAS